MRVTVGLERLSTCPHAFELESHLSASTGAAGSSGAAYLGVCVHKGLEAYFVAKQGGVEDVNIALDAYTAHWYARKPLPPGLTVASVNWSQKGFEEYTEHQTFEDGLMMLGGYLWQMGHLITPVHVEVPFSIEVEGDVIEGTPDLVARIKGRQGLVLVDYKTGSRVKSDADAHTSIQLSAYAWSLRQRGMWSRTDEEVEFHSLARYRKVWKNGTKSKQPYKVAIAKSRRNLINYEWVDEIFIPRLIAQKRSGAYPANPGQHCFRCNVRKACGHWESIEQAYDDIEFDERGDDDSDE